MKAEIEMCISKEKYLSRFGINEIKYIFLQKNKKT